MRKSAPLFCALLLSLSARRAWIEMVSHQHLPSDFRGSLSARRAWIEICCPCCPVRLLAVALRKESVDRNRCSVKCAIRRIKSLSARRAWIEIPRPSITGYFFDVALRKESVDRNQNGRNGQNIKRVALRKESVDRNSSGCQKKIGRLLSLSARRAWIEIGWLLVA